MIEKILNKIHEVQDGLMDAQGNFEYSEHEGAYNALCNLEAYIDFLSKQPASNDLEEAAQQYAKYTAAPPSDVAYHFVSGANWQKEQMMKDSVDAVVCKHVNNTYLQEMDKDAIAKVLAEYNDLDRVKVIIIKEEVK